MSLIFSKINMSYSIVQQLADLNPGFWSGEKVEQILETAKVEAWLNFDKNKAVLTRVESLNDNSRPASIYSDILFGSFLIDEGVFKGGVVTKAAQVKAEPAMAYRDQNWKLFDINLPFNIDQSIEPFNANNSFSKSNEFYRLVQRKEHPEFSPGYEDEWRTIYIDRRVSDTATYPDSYENWEDAKAKLRAWGFEDPFLDQFYGYTDDFNEIDIYKTIQKSTDTKNVILQYKGNEYLLGTAFGTFSELKDLLVDDPWWHENQDTTQGLAGPDELVNQVIVNTGREWFDVSNDLSYDNYYGQYGGGNDLPVFAALYSDQQSTVGIKWLHDQGHVIGDNAQLSAEHFYLTSALLGRIGSFVEGEGDKVFHVNSKPSGWPLLTGYFKSGEIINIDVSEIVDADNLGDWKPAYEYSWEVFDDKGDRWSSLTSNDASDGDNSYTLTSADVGKQLRGVVSYLDGYGTNETLKSAPMSVSTDETEDLLIFNSSGFSSGKSITSGKDGLIYVVGMLTGDSRDVFIRALTPSVSTIWSTTISTPETDDSESVILDDDGNIYISGISYGSGSFPGSDETKAQDSYNGFLSKFDDEGNLLWSRINNDSGVSSTALYWQDYIIRVGENITDVYTLSGDPVSTFATPGTLRPESASIDGSGNIYTAGPWGIASFDLAGNERWKHDSSGLGKSILSGVSNEIFYAAFSSKLVAFSIDGEMLWEQPVQGFYSVRDVELDHDTGNILITGFSYGDNGNTSNGDRDIKLAYYDQDGSHISSKLFGTGDADFGYDSTIVGDNFYATGLWDGGDSVVLSVQRRLLNDESISKNPPSGLALSDYYFNENIAAGSALATLLSIDDDSGDTHAYSLVSGDGDVDNSSFIIEGDQLKIISSPDFEAKSSYAIRLQTKDSGGQTFEKAFNLKVSDLNETPTNISVSASSFNENIADSSIVASLSSSDPDAGDSLTYELVSGSGDDDNAAFRIEGDQLKIRQSPDFESKSSYAIRLQTKDSGGQTFEKSFNLKVNDLAESMIDILRTSNGYALGNGDVVAVNYQGNLLSGEEFDANYDFSDFTSVEGRAPFEFTLGVGQVIQGWDQGLVGQRLGSVVELTIPAEQAYGETGVGDRIPPNSPLKFKVELLAALPSGSQDPVYWNFDDLGIDLETSGLSNTLIQTIDDLKIGLDDADLLNGSEKNDLLIGLDGGDYLNGGYGADVLIGGEHGDTFVYQSVQDSPAIAGQSDHLLEFKSNDRIDLRAITPQLRFISSYPFSGTPGEVRFSKYKLELDSDGDGTADLELLMPGTSEINENQIISSLPIKPETQYVRRADSAYVIVEGPTWEEAETNANALGGHLVTINDAEENEWVENLVTQNGEQYAWIGLFDKDKNDTWHWVNGEPLEYENWDEGQPYSQQQDIVGILSSLNTYGTTGTWHDFNSPVSSNRPQIGVAEIPLAPNNTPTGTPILTGDFKVGQTISIDASSIEDTDNFEGWTPTYKYTWEIAHDLAPTWGLPDWELLDAPDATDGDDNLEITDDLTDKLIRGVVSYMDGYGTVENIASNPELVLPNEPNKAFDPSQYTLYLEGEFAAGNKIAVDASELHNSKEYLNGELIYQIKWERSQDEGNTWEEISLIDPDDHHSYSLTDADSGAFIRAKLQYVTADGEVGTLLAKTRETIARYQDKVMPFSHGLEIEFDGVLTEFTREFIFTSPVSEGGNVIWGLSGDGLFEDWELGTWFAFGSDLYQRFMRSDNTSGQTDVRLKFAEGETYSLVLTVGDDNGTSIYIDGIKVWSNWQTSINSGKDSGWISNETLGHFKSWNGDGVFSGDFLRYRYWNEEAHPEQISTLETSLSTPAYDLAVRGGVITNGIGSREPIILDEGIDYASDTIEIDGYKIVESKSSVLVRQGNYEPEGHLILNGDSEVGRTISVDASGIEDADNFEGWAPSYEYSWEVSSDGGTTWAELVSADATDGDVTLEITDDLTGKLIRGAVSYIDGHGIKETVYSLEQKLVVELRTIFVPAGLTAKVGQIIEVPVTITQAEGIQALDLNFAFDSERFAVPPTGELVRPGSIISDWTLIGNYNTNTESLNILAFSMEPLSSISGEIAYLRLQVKGDAPSGDAVIDLVSASLNQNEFEVDLKDGALLITKPKISIASDLIVPIGSSIDIPITIDDAAEVQSLDLVFAYDPDIFSIPSNAEVVSASDLTGDWSFSSNTATPGEIKIIGFGTTPLEGGEGRLVNLNLKVNSGIDTGSVLLDLVSASFNEGQMTADVVDGFLELLPPTFQVTDVRQTVSGLVMKLSAAPDLEKLNLYDGNDASIDWPDLQLTRSNGTVVEDLSIHWKAETNELYLIQTDSLTGISKDQFATGASLFQSDRLAEGGYRLIIDARSDGLVSASSGELIDGNGDGITGDAFAYYFTKTASENVISIGDTTRGSGQSLGLNGIAHSNDINGLPVLVSTTAEIRSISGNVSYDATAFDNASLVVGHDLPDDWTLDTQENDVGSLNYTASGITAITGTDKELFRFDAVVSEDATYGSSTLIEATIETPEDPNLSFESDPSLVVLAYSGDTTGNGSHSSLDASRIQRVVVGLDSGFDAFDDINPALIGDTTGNGSLSSLDASRIQQEVVGLPVHTFPSISGI